MLFGKWLPIAFENNGFCKIWGANRGCIMGDSTLENYAYYHDVTSWTKSKVLFNVLNLIKLLRKNSIKLGNWAQSNSHKKVKAIELWWDWVQLGSVVRVDIHLINKAVGCYTGKRLFWPSSCKWTSCSLTMPFKSFY